MLRTRLAAGFATGMLMAVGLGFLLASAYLALESVSSASTAALLIGLGLVSAAAVVALVALSVVARTSSSGGVAPASEASSPPTLVADLQSAEMIAQQLGAVLRNVNPVTVVLLAAGILVGLLRRR
jgi:hypothetical protein